MFDIDPQNPFYQVVSAACSTGALIIGALGWWAIAKIKKNVRKIEVNTNSSQTQLVEVTKQLALIQGKKEGIKEGVAIGRNQVKDEKEKATI